MSGNSLDPKIKVTPKEDGAVITVDGFDIVITIKPSEEIPIELPVLIKPSLTVELVKKDLDLYLEDIDITEDDENIVVMPKRYLGRDKFAPLAEIIRLLGGNYVSAGRESKFLIPKSETKSD
jgi:hypothetical protein